MEIIGAHSCHLFTQLLSVNETIALVFQMLGRFSRVLREARIVFFAGT